MEKWYKEALLTVKGRSNATKVQGKLWNRYENVVKSVKYAKSNKSYNTSLNQSKSWIRSLWTWFESTIFESWHSKDPQLMKRCTVQYIIGKDFGQVFSIIARSVITTHQVDSYHLGKSRQVNYCVLGWSIDYVWSAGASRRKSWKDSLLVKTNTPNTQPPVLWTTDTRTARILHC